MDMEQHPPELRLMHLRGTSRRSLAGMNSIRIEKRDASETQVVDHWTAAAQGSNAAHLRVDHDLSHPIEILPKLHHVRVD